MPDIPSKAYLDARDDQLLATVRDARAGLEAAGAGEFLRLGETLAALLREQFPAEGALGRITLSVARSLASIQGAAEAGAAVSPGRTWSRSAPWQRSSLTGKGHGMPDQTLTIMLEVAE